MVDENFGASKFLLALAAFTMLLDASECLAQQTTGTLKQRMIGSWELVSAIFEQAGAKRDIYGSNPRGFATFNSDGHFSLTLLRSTLPKISSNNREAPTAEESKAIATGVLAYYGRYTVSDDDANVTFHIKASTFPNWDGMDQKRTVTVSGDELKIVNTATTAGSGTAYVAWKRAK
jgi:lipocalin-like protein